MALQQCILLITGWGCGTQPLDALKQALQQQGHQVELWNIFNALDEHILAQKVERARCFDVIGGWSLGGQLATILVKQIEAQYAQQKVLMTLASNPCFVASATWQTGMPPQTFQQFKQSFENDAAATLKKFSYMLCQGQESSKTDFIRLQNLIQPQPITLLQQGLILLEELNTTEILKNYSGQQYHIFATQDTLVDCKAGNKIQDFPAKFIIVDKIEGSHACPVFKIQEVSHKICQYLPQIN